MSLPKNLNSYLSKRFYNARAPGGFTSAYKLYQVIKKEGKYQIPLSKIESWARGQDILTLHKTVRRRQPAYRRLIAPGPGHLWDCDLLQLTGKRFTEANSGYSYVLITVDIFSRYCRAEMVKNKGSSEMFRAFVSIFDKTDKLPLFLRSDNGVEFSNSKVQKLFQEKGIKHYFASTETKANYAEILIKNIKKRLFQFFQKNNSYSYEEALQAIVNSYNRTYHESIGMAPSEVRAENNQRVWDYQYVTHSPAYKRTLVEGLKSSPQPPPLTTTKIDNATEAVDVGGVGKEKKKKKKMIPKKRKRMMKMKEKGFKYAIGQTVRVAYFARKPFDRAYDEQFTGEVFKVRSRIRHEGIPIYRLYDYAGESVKGHFYEGELTAFTFDPNALFKIEKVLGTRVRNGIRESLVKYQSWPKRYNEWIRSSDIKPLNRRKKRKKSG